MDLYTTRFAGAVVHAMQLDAISRDRRWRGTYLNTWWDGGQESIGFKVFDRWGVRANLGLMAAHEWQRFDKALLAVIDRLWFTAGVADSGDPLPLGKVPPVVFSEAMRDVSLFVAAASVSNDPIWIERQGHYSEVTNLLARTFEIANGAISKRREVLAESLPLFLDASQYVLEEAELRISGTLRTYEIDLASGGARVERSDRWLDFGPQAERQIAKENLVPNYVTPLEEDAVLRRILGRARLLANDMKIKAEGLREQILS
jgi:hypothetical protein